MRLGGDYCGKLWKNRVEHLWLIARHSSWSDKELFTTSEGQCPPRSRPHVSQIQIMYKHATNLHTTLVCILFYLESIHGLNVGQVMCYLYLAFFLYVLRECWDSNLK